MKYHTATEIRAMSPRPLAYTTIYQRAVTRGIEPTINNGRMEWTTAQAKQLIEYGRVGRPRKAATTEGSGA